MGITKIEAAPTGRPSRRGPHGQTIRGITHLTCQEAGRLLTKTGIPLDKLPAYKRTILASNISFWDHLSLLDGCGFLEVRGGRVFERNSQ